MKHCKKPARILAIVHFFSIPIVKIKTNSNANPFRKKNQNLQDFSTPPHSHTSLDETHHV